MDPAIVTRSRIPHGEPGASVGRLLRLPVFYKALFANAIIVVLVSVGSASAALELLEHGSGLRGATVFLVICAIAAAVTLPVYASVLRLALSPLDALERAADEVASGRVDARAEVTSLADPRLGRVIRVFNRLLDSVAADQARLRDLAGRAFKAQEAERVRIAHELEGETAQTLSALLIRLRVARRAHDAATQEKLLDELRGDIVDLTNKIRDFAEMLHSPTLAEVGLVAAVESYARSLSVHARLDIRVEPADIDGLLTPDGELAVYRIVQEALSNVVRHAGATTVHITVAADADDVRATVEDDGRGFDAALVEKQEPCLGLFGMRERALYVGGTVDVESRPGRGSRVTIRIPLADPRAAACRALTLAAGTAA